jgi:hypothetical protein
MCCGRHEQQQPRVTLETAAAHPIATNAEVPVTELDCLVWSNDWLTALAVVNLRYKTNQARYNQHDQWVCKLAGGCTPHPLASQWIKLTCMVGIMIALKQLC